MVYLKSLLSGLGGALLAAVLWITVALVLPLAGPYLLSRVTGTGGFAASYVDSNSVLLAALIGFILAFAWKWRRLRAA